MLCDIIYQQGDCFIEVTLGHLSGLSDNEVTMVTYVTKLLLPGSKPNTLLSRVFVTGKTWPRVRASALSGQC